MIRPPAPPGGRRVDLHTHSYFSDGTLSPEALVALAIGRGLAALSITDHDSIDAVSPAREAAHNAIEFIPGIELSTAQDGLELHILGYFLDPLHESLGERLALFRGERLERALAIMERLNALGAPVNPTAVIERAGPGVIGRPHIAVALMESGSVESIDEAFRRFLGRDGLAFIPRPAFHPEEAIALIHGAGGVSVLAHPGAQLSDEVIEHLADAGLRGIEVWHPQHTPTTVRRYRALTLKLGLLETGGSDFHGTHRVNLGDLSVPARVLVGLKEAAGVTG
jgi:hypothetical protein